MVCSLCFPAGPTDSFSFNGKVLVFFSFFPVFSPSLSLRNGIHAWGTLFGLCWLVRAWALTRVSHFSFKVSRLV